jgi:glycosyltransferase involved in cell wall biosynthesis
VVIDSGSDATKEIAIKYGAEVINFEWNGKFPKKRNWYLQNHLPTTKWILFLDADEYLTDAFKKELQHTLPNSDKVGYWLNYTIFFLGKKLKRGYRLKKLALFKTGAGEYERIDEERWSTLDMEVHEHPVLKGRIGKIKSKIEHRNFNGIDHYLSKHYEYANWEAARFLKLVNNNSAHLTLKQKIKYRLMKTPFIGVFYFLGTYIFMGGFLDGAKGLAFAILKMSYYTQIYRKILENKNNNKLISESKTG